MLRPCGHHFYPPSLPETHSLGFGWDSVLVKETFRLQVTETQLRLIYTHKEMNL